MYPPAPSFKGPMRLAQLSDVPRIGVVAAAAFYHSYPLDTLASYRKSFRSAILDPDSVVLVVEDTLNETEVASVYAALSGAYPSFEQQIPKHLLDQNKAVLTFNDRMVIDMMLTHPAYWRRGHATLAAEWFIHLARHDQIDLGVAAAPMGKALFSHLGFTEAKTVEIPGCDDHPGPIYAWLGLRDVKVEESGSTTNKTSAEL